MNKEDKELIYDLLKKADANITGFTGEAFKGEVEFVDEIVGSPFPSTGSGQAWLRDRREPELDTTTSVQ